MLRPLAIIFKRGYYYSSRKSDKKIQDNIFKSHKIIDKYIYKNQYEFLPDGCSFSFDQFFFNTCMLNSWSVLMVLVFLCGHDSYFMDEVVVSALKHCISARSTLDSLTKDQSPRMATVHFHLICC